MVMGDLPVETQVLVLGAGPGGYAAAFRAADLGLDVTLVSDEARPGGVCLHRGCIPSKALLQLAELRATAAEAAEHGLDFGTPSWDLEAVRGWKDAVVDRLTKGLVKLCDERGVQWIQGRGRFAGPERLLLEGSDYSSVSFEHAIVATGSRPSHELHRRPDAGRRTGAPAGDRRRLRGPGAGSGVCGPGQRHYAGRDE